VVVQRRQMSDRPLRMLKTVSRNRLSPDDHLPDRLLASTSSPRFSMALGRGVNSIAVAAGTGFMLARTPRRWATDEASFGGAHPHPLPTTGICSGGRPDRCAIGRPQVKLVTAIDQE
jgi:hypothetical protein